MSEQHGGLWAAIKSAVKKNLLAGLLVVTPIAATIFFLVFLLKWVDRILLLIPEPYRPSSYLPFPVPGLGLVLLVCALILIGFMARNILGRQLVALGEYLLSYIPFVSKFYSAVKQLLETIFGSSKDFKRVVLIEYPRRGLFALAFVTGATTPAIERKTGQRCINVFLPTTPNPTSGFYLIVPEEDVIPLDMNVEEAFKVLISGGIIDPARGNGKAG